MTSDKKHVIVINKNKIQKTVKAQYIISPFAKRGKLRFGKIHWRDLFFPHLKEKCTLNKALIELKTKLGTVTKRIAVYEVIWSIAYLFCGDCSCLVNQGTVVFIHVGIRVVVGACAVGRTVVGRQTCRRRQGASSPRWVGVTLWLVAGSCYVRLSLRVY